MAEFKARDQTSAEFKARMVIWAYIYVSEIARHILYMQDATLSL